LHEAHPLSCYRPRCPDGRQLNSGDPFGIAIAAVNTSMFRHRQQVTSAGQSSVSSHAVLAMMNAWPRTDRNSRLELFTAPGKDPTTRERIYHLGLGDSLAILQMGCIDGRVLSGGGMEMPDSEWAPLELMSSLMGACLRAIQGLLNSQIVFALFISTQYRRSSIISCPLRALPSLLQYIHTTARTTHK
jgi:hypothetical protein